jgi:hypothetical protein
VLDVNETLLDLEAIRPTFERIFDDPAALRLWFASLITYSEALTLAGVDVPFTDIGAAVLRMLAATRGIDVSPADPAELTDRFASMPPLKTDVCSPPDRSQSANHSYCNPRRQAFAVQAGAHGRDL